MAEKLAESTWTAFTKKAKLALDDAGLVKALAKFDKTDAAKPEPRIDALKEVVDQVKKQVTALTKKKKELGDKPFNEAKDKLYVLLDLAEALQKETEAAASSAEEEADSPVLLTTKMLPLVREIRKGGVTMHALICTAGRNTAVLVMRKAIATTRRKLLQEMVDAKGGAKFIVGQVLLENKALTFVVQSPAAGLAKRLRQALLDQLELRLKVRVRGDDGAEDTDGEDEEEGSESQAEESKATAGGGTIPKAPPLRDAPAQTYAQKQRQVGDPGSEDHGTAFKARLTTLIPKIKQSATESHPHAVDMKLAASEAGVLAGKKKFTEANALLDRIDGWLGGSGIDGRTSGGIAAALAAWRTAKDSADQEIDRLRQALQRSGQPRLLRIAEQGITEGGLNALTGGRMVSLWTALMDGIETPQDAAKRARVKQAASELRSFIAGDRRIALCEINPMTGPIQLRERLLPALAEVDRLVSA